MNRTHKSAGTFAAWQTYWQRGLFGRLFFFCSRSSEIHIYGYLEFRGEYEVVGVNINQKGYNSLLMKNLLSPNVDDFTHLITGTPSPDSLVSCLVCKQAFSRTFTSFRLVREWI